MHTHHAIDYIELRVTDIAESKRFYAAAFDWTFNDYGPGYAGINGESREVGGLAQSDEVHQGGPIGRALLGDPLVIVKKQTLTNL